MAQTKEAVRCLSLGLQGGGSFGAFTWGVLDRLLEADGPEFDVISGASAGAVNAVALASGLATGGRAAARATLERVWHRVAAYAPAAGERLARAAETALRSRFLGSPYQFNPLDLNPLREILAREINFDGLRAAAPVRLLIAATRVRDGQARLFRETEITVEAVLASACLPLLQQAVEIEGESYWDGGYSANPPLRRLVLESAAHDVLLVRLLLNERPELPHFSYDIAQRTREMAFNASLLKEVDSVRAMQDACAGQKLFASPICRKLGKMRFHSLAADEHVPDLAHENPLNAAWPFLVRLRDAGRRAADAWLREGHGAGLSAAGLAAHRRG